MNSSLDITRYADSFFASYGLVSLALAIFSIIAMWKIFTKAGEEGWKSIIPIYNLHVFARICWKTSIFWYCMLASCVLLGVGVALNNVFGVILMVAAGIIDLVYAVKSMLHLGKRFGKTTGFSVVMLILLNVIGMLILGFGADDYQIMRDN